MAPLVLSIFVGHREPGDSAQAEPAGFGPAGPGGSVPVALVNFVLDAPAVFAFGGSLNR